MHDVIEKFARQAELFADLAVPWCHRRSSPDGCDCIGLVLGCLKGVGFLRLYPLPIYSPEWNLHEGGDDRILDGLLTVAERIPGPIQRGDIIVFHNKVCPTHVGIMLDSDIFVHSMRINGKCKRDILNKSPLRRFVMGYYRLSVEKLETRE